MAVSRLGPYYLGPLLGRGATGRVWAARYGPEPAGAERTDPWPLAVKVLRPEVGDPDVFRELFQHEVRAVAALSHPGIVTVLDYGEAPLDPHFDAAEDPAPGMPYLVMERLHGGTLGAARRTADWATILQAARALLSALGHAHARGVIHRDIKPGNVVVTPDASRFVLTDFGIAHAVLGRELGRDLFGPGLGTPSYMPPEQVRGHTREIGPWSDLYSLGCLVWTLACGRPPFVGASHESVLEAHVRRPLPEPVYRVPVPSGLTAWLRRALEKHPGDRFGRAQEALGGLDALGEPDPDTPLVSGGAERAPPDGPSWSGAELPTILSANIVIPQGPRARAERARVPRRPVPERWADEPAPPERPGIAEGLGLFGLRRPRLVGREAERAALWSALREAHRASAPRAVVLRGPAGVGKSRLAEWILERGHALAVTTGLRAYHAPVPGLEDGLAPMLRRFYRSGGLDAAETREQISARLAEDGEVAPLEALTLARWIHADAASATVFRSASERYEIARRVLVRASRRYLPILEIDDAQWGLDALALAAHLLGASAAAGAPALIVLTVRDDLLGDLPEAAALLGELEASPAATTLRVGPLGPEASRAMVQQLLPLAPEASENVEARSGGSPLLAAQIIGGWVREGRLVRGERGLALRDAPARPVVDEPRAVALARLESLLGRAPEALLALELAATLGPDVDGAELAQATALAGLEEPADAVEVLLREGLAVRGRAAGPRGGFAFAHSTVREALSRRARAGGRAAWWHGIVAELIATQDPYPSRDVRLGQHRLAAGRLADALEPLAAAAEARVGTGDLGEAAALLTAHRAARRVARIPARDPRAARGALAEARLARYAGRYDDARATLEGLAADAAALGAGELAVQVQLERGHVLRMLGALDEAEAAFSEAVRLAAPLGPGPRAAASRGLGLTLLHRGAFAAAAARLGEALAIHREAGERFGAAGASAGLAAVFQRQGLRAEALAAIAAAEADFEAAGSRWGMADAANIRGEIHRDAGELALAERAYRRSVELWEGVGSAEVAVPRVNLALVLVASAQFEEALPLLAAAEASFAARGAQPVVAAVRAGIARCHVASGRWAEAREVIDAVAAFLADVPSYVDHDIATLLESAGASALGSASDPHDGARDVAARALSIAAAQLERLGRAEGARAAREQLERARSR